MPKSPEPTTINSVLASFDREFPEEKDNSGYTFELASPNGHGADLDDARLLIKAFLRQAILKTCDEILGATKLDDDMADGASPTWLNGYKRCRQAIESKIRELKGL